VSAKNNFKKFLENLSSGYGGAMVSPGYNFYYLTGLQPASTLERLFLLIISGKGNMVILAPRLYEEEIKNSWTGDMMFWDDTDDPYRILCDIINSLTPLNEPQKWLIEDTMPVSMFLKIKKYIKDFEFEPLSNIISQLRVIKSREEIECHKKAADVVDKVFKKIIEYGLKGKSEKEVAEQIEYLIKNSGADGIAFEPIVASGPNSANPHHSPNDRLIKDGDMVVLDYGAKCGGYCSDITRTVAVGEISEEAKKVYEVVKQAQQEGIKRVRENISAKDVDLSVRNIIERNGYGKYFIHRTGHGLGLEVHEEPYISSSSETFLREGMVFTIEPGIYLPGMFGVRIENDVAVTNGEAERLTNAEIELVQTSGRSN
jgi:Xaa-Pro dipeptidase